MVTSHESALYWFRFGNDVISDSAEEYYFLAKLLAVSQQPNY